MSNVSDFNIFSQTLFSYNGDDTSVVIPDSVLNIGDSAFFEVRKSLERVSLPKVLPNIGRRAFQYCEKLTQIDFPVSLRSIGNEAFSHCSGLTQITFPENVQTIGHSAFSNCSGLNQITFLGSVTTVERGAFSDCSALSQINILGKSIYVESYAFSCSGLKNVLFLGQKLELRPHVFEEYSPSIEAPNLLISDFPTEYRVCAIKGFLKHYWGEEPYSDEIQAGYLKYIRGQRKRLYKTAVHEPDLLRLMMAEKMIPQVDFETVRTLIEETDNPELMAALLEYRGANLKSVDPVKEMGKQIKKQEKELEHILSNSFPAAEAKKSWRFEKKNDGTIVILGYKGEETDVIVPAFIAKSAVSEIGEYAFSPEGSLITDKIRAVRKKLHSVVIPDSVTKIGKSAFEECEKLEQITLPNTMVGLGERAFKGCKKLANSNGIVVVGDTLFDYLGRKGTVAVPEGVRHISSLAFSKYDYALDKISLPEGIVSIGEEAFFGCCNLTEIVLPESLVFVGDGAFGGCKKLADANGMVIFGDTIFGYYGPDQYVVIPEGISRIGKRAFFDGEVVGITLPESVVSIGEAAFFGCEKLEKIDLPESLKSIGDKAFNGCAGLADSEGLVIFRGVLYDCFGSKKQATVPEGVKSIGTQAFAFSRRNSKVDDIKLPESLENIGDRAFSDRFLVKLTFPDKTINISKSAFNGCKVVVISAPADSFAEQYAKEHKYTFFPTY